MEKNDLKQFAVVLAGLGEVFEPGNNISSIRAELYYQTLKKYDIKDIRAAATKIISKRKYNSLPKPAEIIEAIEGDDNERTLKAWLEVDRVLRGPRGQIIKDSAINKAVNAVGGWGVLNTVNESELKFIQKNFERAYIFYSKEDQNKTTIPMGKEGMPRIKDLTEKIGEIYK